jgi:hypothetical protein
MAITSAFQADDAGSIPAARSSFTAKSPLARVGFLLMLFYWLAHDASLIATRPSGKVLPVLGTVSKKAP